VQGGLLKGLVRGIFRTPPSAFTVATVSPPDIDSRMNRVSAAC
jgi:hypothetical protein